MVLIPVNTSSSTTPSIFKAMKAIYICFEGILNRLVHIKSNKKDQRELPKDLNVGFTIGRDHEDQHTDYFYEKDMYRQFLSKTIVFYEQGICHPVVDKTYQAVLYKFAEAITRSLDEDQNDTKYSRGDTFNCRRLYRRPYLDELQTLACLLIPLVSGRNTEAQANNDNKQSYTTILRLIVRLVEDYNRNLNLKESYPENVFSRNTLVPSYRDLIDSLVTIAGEMLVSWLRPDGQKDHFFEAFNTLYEVLRSWMDIGKVDNKALHSLLSAKKSNMLILFYFSLMNADNFKKLAADEKMLLMLMDLYGKQFYVIAEIYALQAFEPENILEMKLKSLVHLDNSGRRILENASIEGLDRYYSSILEQIWKSNFVVRKTTMFSSIIMPRENAGKYLYILKSN